MGRRFPVDQSATNCDSNGQVHFQLFEGKASAMESHQPSISSTISVDSRSASCQKQKNNNNAKGLRQQILKVKGVYSP